MSAVLKSRFPAIIATLTPRMNAVAKGGAEAIERGAKDRVHVNSGDLREAIHTEAGGGGFYVIAGDNDVFYGHLEEHGTSHSAPHPFLVPAFEAEKQAITRSAMAVLRSL